MESRAMAPSATLSIGTLARQAGCTVPTIRYYEEIGLLPAAPRSEGGQRLYGEPALRRLSFIRRVRGFNFSIEQVRELVSLVDEPDRPCLEVRDIAAVHLREVRQKLAELRELEINLAGFVDSCERACAGGTAVNCTILEDLSPPQGSAAAAFRAGCCGG
jgi:MerR family copper efflux transcriptional regulator